MTNYDVELDKATFDAIICDCYRDEHPPLKKKMINGKWVQVPYHHGESWKKNNDMSWLDILKLDRIRNDI